MEQESWGGIRLEDDGNDYDDEDTSVLSDILDYEVTGLQSKVLTVIFNCYHPQTHSTPTLLTAGPKYYHLQTLKDCYIAAINSGYQSRQG